MKIPIAERRQIENEMIFRRINEKVGDDLGELDAMHIEDGNLDLIRDELLMLQFKCECSDENCSLRIPLLLTTYQTIHEDRKTFIVKPGHEVDLIEAIIDQADGYNVVKKNHSTAEPNDVLKKTSVDNV